MVFLIILILSPNQAVTFKGEAGCLLSITSAYWSHLTWPLGCVFGLGMSFTMAPRKSVGEVTATTSMFYTAKHHRGITKLNQHLRAVLHRRSVATLPVRNCFSPMLTSKGVSHSVRVLPCSSKMKKSDESFFTIFQTFMVRESWSMSAVHKARRQLLNIALGMGRLCMGVA